MLAAAASACMSHPSNLGAPSGGFFRGASHEISINRIKWAAPNMTATYEVRFRARNEKDESCASVIPKSQNSKHEVCCSNRSEVCRREREKEEEIR